MDTHYYCRPVQFWTPIITVLDTTTTRFRTNNDVRAISVIGNGLVDYVVLSPPGNVPPIYDVRGKVSVSDNVVADDRACEIRLVNRW